MHVPGWWTGFVVLAVVWAGLPPHLLAFSILVPEDLSVVEPGRPISVQVDPGGEIGLERVGYSGITVTRNRRVLTKPNPP